jgi:2-polyprenyl-6-methoxyphenol hydroxylase-like FAD-dependent oxidoreductase
MGDAAHQFPPAGGFGMNTAIQDAHNFAWKLASVLSPSSSFNAEESRESSGNNSLACCGSRWLQGASRRGPAGMERLLDSYEAERRPVALMNTALSMRNWRESLKVLLTVVYHDDSPLLGSVCLVRRDGRVFCLLVCHFISVLWVDDAYCRAP